MGVPSGNHSKLDKDKVTHVLRAQTEFFNILPHYPKKPTLNIFNLEGKVLRNIIQRNNILISIYKNKGDAQVYDNYRWIKLLSHKMKIRKRVIERKIRQEKVVRENQFNFMPRWSIIEVIMF